jgi:uncharacterized membrane protein
MDRRRRRNGLACLVAGGLMIGLGAFNLVTEEPLDKKMFSSNYELINKKNYSENWKYYIGMEGLGGLMIASGWAYLKKR